MGFGAICAAIGSLYFDMRDGCCFHPQYLLADTYYTRERSVTASWSLGLAIIFNIIIFDSGKITISNQAF
jgi:hypothetical protein